MKKKEPQDIREIVWKGYATVAEGGCGCCGPSSCCAGVNTAEQISGKIGYSSEEMDAVPDGANLGLGCGNPLAHAAIHEGNTVLDLGSGAGFDCFLASRKVGKTGRVIGVDMTPEMLGVHGRMRKRRALRTSISALVKSSRCRSLTTQSISSYQTASSTSRPIRHGSFLKPSGCSNPVARS